MRGSGRTKLNLQLFQCYIDECLVYGLTTLNKPKSREVYTNDGIITQNIFNAAVPTSIETK